MSSLQRLFSLLAVTCVFACSSVAVEYEYGAASFNGFGPKFAWAKTTDDADVEVRPEVLAFIHETIEQGLVGKRYVKAGTDGEADFLVSYRVSKNFAIAASTTNDLTHYEEGALDVFITTPKKAELMWRGRAHAAMDKSLTPSERHQRLQEGITDMLKNFPDAGKEAKR